MSNLKETIEEIMSGDGELSMSDFAALKELVQEKCPGFELREKRKSNFVSTLTLGENEHDGQPYNVTTGYLYQDATRRALLEFSEMTGWCGQFAGKTQWLKFGRKIMSDAKGVKTGRAYGRDIVLYAYEQTEEI